MAYPTDDDDFTPPNGSTPTNQAPTLLTRLAEACAKSVTLEIQSGRIGHAATTKGETSG